MLDLLGVSELLSGCVFVFFFFNDTATTEIYTYLHTLSLHDALPIFRNMFGTAKGQVLEQVGEAALLFGFEHRADVHPHPDRHLPRRQDRKSTRLNSSH